MFTNPDTHGPERPLPPARSALFVVVATLLVALFYLYTALFLIIGSFIWLLLFVLTLLDPQFRGKAVALSLLLNLGAALEAFASALRLKQRPQFGLKLQRKQAPRLWSTVEDLSRQLNVASPQEFVLENNCNAYVNLKGIAAGRGKAKLGVGLDLLAGLSEAQARAIMAHEITHAKYVRRGYQHFLKAGLFRVNVCVEKLQTMGNYKQNSKSVRTLMRVLGALPENIAVEVGKLGAAYSRYEEFRADRVAAEICGPAVFRAALLAVHVTNELSNQLEHRECLLRIEQGAGYANWLHEKLQAPNDAKRLEIEERAIEREPRYQFSSHPTLSDRLNAIDQITDCGSRDNGAESGLVWLHDPDEIAAQMLRQLEQVATRQEAEMTQTTARQIQKGVKNVRAIMDKHFLALVVLRVLVALSFSMWFILKLPFLKRAAISVSSEQIRVITGALAVILFVELLWITRGVVEARNESPAKIGDLCIPSLSFFLTAQLRRREGAWSMRKTEQLRRTMPDAERYALEDEEAKTQAQENIARGAELRANVPANVIKPKEIVRFHVERGYQSLASDDIPFAAHHARLALEIEPCRAEAVLLHSICRAIHGRTDEFQKFLDAPINESSERNDWAISLLATLDFNFGAGEVFLIKQVAFHPKNSALRALLAVCQASIGKMRESLTNSQIAYDLMQQCDSSPPTQSADEACYRFLLARNLTSLGQLKEARLHLDWLAARRALQTSGDNLSGIETFSIDLEELKWLIADGQSENAFLLSEKLIAEYIAGFDQITIGNVLCQSRCESLLVVAQGCFERALQRGFYPDANLSLAQLLHERGENVAARALLLEALNLKREIPYDAIPAVYLLQRIFGELRAVTDAPPATIAGWEVQIDATGLDLHLQFNQLTLLFLAHSETEARN